ncbi:MAG TPA: murein L,D-transpeptidase family protein [Xanthobacteraceae bacterium]
MIRVSLVRALLASAALAAALALGGCYGDDAYQIPTRATRELSPEMLALLQQKNMPKASPILVRIFKEESELELWKQDTSGQYALLKVYPICRWSGELGPKVKEGDRQAPEGFYPISPGLMNPNSNYYLAINTGFPNAYDKANGHTGAFLMIHGDCSSRGCYAMTDEQIGEIYALARESFEGGQKEFQVQAYPFRMTPANLARHRTNPNMPFWKMIKVGNDHFEVSHLEPAVEVCDRHYVFDAQPPPGSNKPLVFNPSGRCPDYVVDPAIAEPALAKQKNDDAQIAQLVKENVPVAPVVMGTDGGMNRVFVAKLADVSATYDDEGHIHAPPVHPGMPMPMLSAGSHEVEPETTAAVASSSSGNFFSNLFAPKVATAEPAAQAQGGAGGSPSAAKKQDAAPTATSAASKRGSEQTDHAVAQKSKPAATTTSLHREPTVAPRNNPPEKIQPQVAEQSKQPARPQQEANAAAPSASSALIHGAQPMRPAGSFDSRWDAFSN